MNPANPLLTVAQNIPGLPQQLHAELIHCVTNIDVNNPAASQEYTDYARNLINLAVDGDSSGGQGLTYLLEVIGTELSTLSYIEVNLEQLGDAVQFLSTEVVTIPDLPLMQHEGVGQGVTAAHNIMDDWNRAVKSETIDRSRFSNLGAARDHLSDVANSLSTTRNALLDLLSQLP